MTTTTTPSANGKNNFTKFACLMISICAFGFLLYIGQEIIVPLIFAAFFAVLLSPIVIFLQRKKVPRVLAISIAVTLAFITVSLIVFFITSQLTNFSDTLPMLEKKFTSMINELISWSASKFNTKQGDVQKIFNDFKADLLDNSKSYIGATLTTLTGLLAMTILIPIYTIMMLYYEPLFMTFIQEVFPKNRHGMVKEIMIESKSVMQSYLGGLLLEAVIVAVMNSAGLLILGIDYAILWGVIGAILNIIPYVGIIIATVFPFLIAIATKDTATYGVMVLLLYGIVQFIDNNIIVPKIVASRVKINALISVIVVLIGGSIWGVSGMFLSIPVIAVVKIIFDRIPYLHAYGYLLGDTMPENTSNFLGVFKRRRKKASA